MPARRTPALCAHVVCLAALAALASGDGSHGHRLHRDEPRPPRPRARSREAPAASRRDTMAASADLQRLTALGYVAGSVPAPAKTGVTIHDRARVQPGLNFYTSGHASEALLVDMSGQVVHRWSCPFDAVWPGRERTVQSGFIRRAAPLAGGRILAVWEGLGLAEIDAQSRVVWKLEEPIHHDVTVAEDGRIFALGREPRGTPHANGGGADPYAEFIVELTARGRLKRRVPLVDAFERAAPGIRAIWTQRPHRIVDALHSNSIQLLDAARAAAIPGAEPGDVLVSLRNLDAVAVVDLEAGAVVWASRGGFARQHEAAIVAGGRLLLFDNLGFERFSAVREYDPRTMRQTWLYAGATGRRFFSRTCGAAHRLANGNTLIVESDPGRAFEVTTGGETVWEFWSPHRAGERDELAATLFDVARLPLDFADAWTGANAARP